MRNCDGKYCHFATCSCLADQEERVRAFQESLMDKPKIDWTKPVHAVPTCVRYDNRTSLKADLIGQDPKTGDYVLRTEGMGIHLFGKDDGRARQVGCYVQIENIPEKKYARGADLQVLIAQARCLQDAINKYDWIGDVGDPREQIQALIATLRLEVIR